MSGAPQAPKKTRLIRSVLPYSWLLATTVAGSMVNAQPNATSTSEGAPAVQSVQVIGQPGQARSAADSAVPVDVLTALDLRSTGAMGNELGEALASITSSFSFPRQSNSVTSDHVRGARLRNLSPDQVLVLVNGKRRHPSAVVNDNTTFGKGSNAFDFNTIPLSAVKRVEILRDGASAQYGSDAIAGVINIVLKDESEAGELELGTGAHASRSPITGSRIRDGETFFVTAHHGISLHDEGFLRVGGELRSRNPTNRAGLNRVPGFVAPPTLDNVAFRGQRTSRSGDPDSEEFRLWANSIYQLRDNASLYFNGTWLKQDTEGAVLFRHPDSNQNVRELYPNGTLPVTTGDNRDIGLSTGIELDLAQWELDIGATYGRNRFDFGAANSLNPSLGADSPTRFHSGRFSFQQSGLQVDAYRNLIFRQLPITVAAGTAYRREDFRSSAGDTASHIAGDFLYNRDVVLESGSSIALQNLVGGPDIGAQGAKGLTPDDTADTGRNVYSAYVDISSQLSEKLFASAPCAGRNTVILATS